MVTASTRFFGYGSLVNLATHDYLNPRTTTVQGWRRQWEYSRTRDLSFLSVIRDPHTSIQGMTADVAGIGWAALDIREAAYKRQKLYENRTDNLHIYVANPDHIDPAVDHKPILLSYLDCVVQGYYQHFGVQGVAAFFDSTSGWKRPVRNDRAAPIYPRAQILTHSETQLVDQHLDQLSVVIEP